MTSTLRALALACLLLAGCASARVDDPVKAGAIVLHPATDAPLSRTVTLSFDRIADSRCPSNVRCVWAGSVAYHFTLSGMGGTEEFKLERGGAFDSLRLKGVRIALSEAVPGPVQAMGAATLPHPVSLTVIRY